MGVRLAWGGIIISWRKLATARLFFMMVTSPDSSFKKKKNPSDCKELTKLRPRWGNKSHEKINGAMALTHSE